REVSGMSADVFARRVAGCRIEGVGRHGKWLILELSPAASSQSAGAPAFLLAHLRMSGRLDVVSQAEAFTPHARVVWLLDGGWALRFDDARKFGRVCLTDRVSDVIGDLGPDALSVDLETFAARLTPKRGALKPILLDQTFVAGVGNIYADEALFVARLHPKRSAVTLSSEEVARLHQAICSVLSEAIAANGASFDWVYPGGNYQDHFKVYGRTGQPCSRCGYPIQRMVVAQRSTHFCAMCQH
ncbi:MAG: DNA-formamidopyrimidine glycosylase, partial [Anaerolineae bacterium]|nr:DNA-formamidopyrimidine glycosylase [Thermoflexales bacterium]MDW8407465.1 DNA-formamidopyrimidine glycosylase [Anaerolineae bacterium]